MINPRQIDISTLPSISFAECKSLPSSPGIYFALSENAEVLYIGRSENMSMRWRNYHHKRTELQTHKCSKLCWLDVTEPRLLDEIERALIEWFKPPLNENSGRPSKYNEAKKQRTIWLTQTAWDALLQEAKSQGLSVSEYLEQLGRQNA